MKILELVVLTTKKLENEKNSKNQIQKIETVLKIWKMRTFEWKTAVFKTWEISNILHITSVTLSANSTMTQLRKTH